MTGEISYDLVMEDDMDFVEGTYRVPQGDWQVFIFTKRPIHQATAAKERLSSGTTGLVICVPFSFRLNKNSVEETMSGAVGVAHWNEVKGPDSIQIR